MTEQSRHWDGVSLGDATLAPYSASEWADQERLEHGQGSTFPNYGILAGTGDGTYSALRVQAKSPASSNVELEIGAALVHGYLYENTAALTLAVGANASGNARIDTLILRADFVAQTVRAIIKQGTPAASPAHPTLQQDTAIWEIPLADIAVANGFTVINQTDITNRQRSLFSMSAGWQPKAEPPGYYIAANYDAAPTTFTPGVNDAVAIPMTLVSNMLIQDVQIRHLTTSISYTIDWGLYTQDTNEGLTAENTARLVAFGTGSGSTVGSTNILLAASPVPQAVPPGTYWLVLHFKSGVVKLGTIAAGNFDYTNGMTLSVAFTSITQTLNLVTNWLFGSVAYAVRIRGRVLGKTTP